MPAPNIQTLYDFETQLETAWVSILTAAFAAASISCGVASTRSAVIEDTPRVDLEVLVGSALKQRRGVTTLIYPNTYYREIPIAFDAKLQVSIVTTRPTNDAEHGAIRGLVRYNLTGSANVIGAQLPYLQVMEQLNESGSSRLIDEKEQDISLLIYDFQFAISNDAWPSGY
jgi:hypothetical protein